MEQREIKFRIWKPEYKRMDFVRLERYFGGRGLYDQYTGCDTGIWMQFTGLKDKNGKEIYFKDWVNYLGINFLVEQDEYGVLLLANGNPINWNRVLPFALESEEKHYIIDTSSFSWEVIGNIYENPDLLTPTTPEP